MNTNPLEVAMRLLTTLLTLTALLTSGCVVLNGDGHPIEELRPLPTFTALENRSFLEVSLEKGPGGEARVRCDSNLLGHLETFVEGDTFVIQMEPGFTVGRHSGCTLEVATPRLSSVTSMGSGNVSVCGAHPDFRRAASTGSGDLEICGVEGDRIEVSSSGSGEVFIGELIAPEVVIFHSGSGGVRIEGSTDELRVDSSGSGATETFALPCRTARVQATGSGTVEVSASESVSGNLTGSGDLRVRGGATVQVGTSGSGRVIHE
ncbi:MAG: DUF2807 domain-containing protein [Deltaproteobacteria bacterium]|nr:DUF2807 domain-containing protein [Deltaproteobacteria bacterium]